MAFAATGYIITDSIAIYTFIMAGAITIDFGTIGAIAKILCFAFTN
jgi:hypothetical protein